jgi:hypothetical protein
MEDGDKGRGYVTDLADRLFDTWKTLPRHAA